MKLNLEGRSECLEIHGIDPGIDPRHLGDAGDLAQPLTERGFGHELFGIAIK
ncbi:hypothetical protein [Baaleninema sp.]|uniref:hypothetical protein n=1 Tax=Baaleninema sp. TaxID=3101197 RepID=UPI003D0190D2